MTWDLGQWEQLPQFFPLSLIDKNIQQYLQKASNPVGIACSGGPDSLCLLLLFRLYWPETPCLLLHYNHKIRSESDSEELHMIELAQQLKIPYAIGHRSSSVGTDENALRQARYLFFKKTLRRHCASLLLLGHHQDDLIETSLMRFFRGSSLQGLIAPRPVQIEGCCVKLRPLLTFSKQLILSACQTLGIHYFHDATNDNDICRRNGFRHHVLPALNHVFQGPSWRFGFERSCQILTEQRQYLDVCLSEKFKTTDWKNTVHKRSDLNALLPYELRYFLQNWFQSHGVKNIRFELLDQCIAAIQNTTNATINLESQVRLSCKKNTIQLIASSLSPMVPFRLKFSHGCVCFPQQACLKIKTMTLTPTLCKSILAGKFPQQKMVFLDAEVLKPGPLILRTWQAGDRYIPLGHAHAKKIKTLGCNYKIPCNQKFQRPVICNAKDEILWMPGLPPSETWKVHGHTKFCVFLIYQMK